MGLVYLSPDHEIGPRSSPLAEIRTCQSVVHLRRQEFDSQMDCPRSVRLSVKLQIG